MKGKPEIALLLLGIAVATIFSESTAWSCDPIQWTTSKHWNGGDLVQDSFFLKGCDTLVTRSDLFPCEPLQPFHQCQTDSQCPAGSLCAQSSVPRICVACSTTSTHTSYDSTPIVTNVTANMLAGKFWMTDTFFNHTGVDYIVQQENWSWSASGNALSHDSVWHRRSTWASGGYDQFRSTTERYTIYNATHVQKEAATFTRMSEDTGVGGVKASSGTEYLSSRLPSL